MGLLDDNLKARFKKAGDKNAPQAEKELDIVEFYRLRAKMLGVLIRDARLNAARTETDCARIIGVPEATYQQYEFGEDAPSLPQIEILAFYLGVPVSHFWGSSTLQDEYDNEQRIEDEYMRLRHRMVGAMLQQAREAAGLSQQQLADEAKLNLSQIQQYERGETAIPMHVLNVLARAVNQTMEYFLESSGHIGELLAMREQWKHFQDLPEDLRQFAANPVNIGFIEIALMLSKMPTEKLRSVGRSIVDITM